MSDSTTPPEAPAQEPGAGEGAPKPEAPKGENKPEEPKDWEAEATRLRDELAKARKWEDRAKENHAKVQQYEREKLPEAERQIAEAEARGRSTAVGEFGKRLARTEFDAIAGRRNPDFKTDEVFEWLDLSRFVGEDGEPDTAAIKSAVERLVPSGGTPPPPSFDGGTRTAAPAGTDMNSILRRSTGRA